MKHEKAINDMLRYINEKIEGHDIADDVKVNVYALQCMKQYITEIKKDLEVLE